MRVYCTVCKEKISSAIVGNTQHSIQLQIVDIMVKVSEHVQAHHPTEATVLAQDLRALIENAPWFMVMSTFANVPDDEQALLEKIESFEDLLLKMVGEEIEEGDNATDSTEKPETSCVRDSEA